MKLCEVYEAAVTAVKKGNADLVDKVTKSAGLVHETDLNECRI